MEAGLTADVQWPPGGLPLARVQGASTVRAGRKARLAVLREPGAEPVGVNSVRSPSAVSSVRSASAASTRTP